MASLIYKNGQFSFDGIVPDTLDVGIVDVDLIVYDDVPNGTMLSIINRACDYINRKYGTSYSAYPGDICKSDSVKSMQTIKFRMKKEI